MKLIIDPDHWFAPAEHIDSAECVLESQDGTEGLLLADIPEQRRRELRDEIDKGEGPTEPLIVRDIDAARREHPGFVARSVTTRAPTLANQYPNLAATLNESPAPVTFADVQQLIELVETPAELDRTVAGDLLGLVIASRRRNAHVPRPETVKLCPEAVGTLLNYDSPDDLREKIVREQFLTDTPLLSTPRELSDRERLWLSDLGWLEDREYTSAGKVARQYARQRSTERTELEAMALLEQASEQASENGNLLVSGKLDDAIDDLDIDIEGLASSLRTHLTRSARAAAYERAISVASDAEALRVDSVLDVTSHSDLLDAVKQSRPERLNSISNGLGQVPLSLLADAPDGQLPATIDHIVTAMEPLALGPAVDEAIAMRQSRLDKTLKQVEIIVGQIEPLLTPATAKRLKETVLSARTMRNLLSPPEPDTAVDCVDLYNKQIEREVAVGFGFEKTKDEVSDAILATCEEYIREQYRTWATSDPSEREVAMIVDTPALISERFDQYDHLVVMISDGFGLRQWLNAKHSLETVQEWYESGMAANTLMTTIFPSETGAGHYSFLTGQFPEDHGRDAIGKPIDVDSVSLFEAARDANAHVKAFSYLPKGNGGFSRVMAEHADGFERLEAMQAESSALAGQSQQAVAGTIAQHERSLSVIQHNQIDQLHEGSDHIADTLISEVPENVVEYIQGLAEGISDNVGFILTADHGMIRTRHPSQVNLKHGKAHDALKQCNERYEGSRLGQRVAGLEARSTKTSTGPKASTNKTEYFEVLPEKTMRELRALTNDKCSGRSLRMRRRYYSESKQMTATHGAFTFDEMFIPFVEFDLNRIAAE